MHEVNSASVINCTFIIASSSGHTHLWDKARYVFNYMYSVVLKIMLEWSCSLPRDPPLKLLKYGNYTTPVLRSHGEINPSRTKTVSKPNSGTTGNQ